MSDPPSLQMVASKALGGAERWFIRFAAALEERGAPVELAIRRGSGLDGHDFGRLKVHRLPYLSVWDPISAGAVARLIRRVRPAIVQTYMGRATRLTHLPDPGRGGAVHIARLGGYYRLGPYRHAHHWIGNTRGLCDWMVSQGLPGARVHHIYNFADTARPVDGVRLDAVRAELVLPDDAWVLVTLGRMVPVKGHGYLIDALARLPEGIAGRSPHLVLVGDGPLAPDLRTQARQLGIDGRIRWAGWQPDPRPYLQLADLVVFPSLDAETLGNVILEAWSWRRPLVATAFRGARELVHHGEDAWVCPCEDAAALADGIRGMLDDPALMSAMAARGHERVLVEFGRDVVMDQYSALYRRLAGG